VIHDPLINAFIGEVRRVQAEDAEAALLRPKRDLFGLGETAGNYQGLQRALDILDDVLSDQLEKEIKS